MKIAAISDDGISISEHFGRAPYYVVVTVKQDKVVKREVRDKLGHAQFIHQEGHAPEAGRHGYGPGAQDRHAGMAASIADCQVLLCRGMGWGAYEAMKQRGITPIVTDIPSIDDAVRAYLDGTIVDQTERLH